MCCPEVTVTSLHPPRLCQPTLLLSHISLASLSLLQGRYSRNLLACSVMLFRDRLCDDQDHEALRISSLRTFRLQNPSLRFTPLGLAFCFYQLVIHNHIACVNFPLARGEKVWMTMGILQDRASSSIDETRRRWQSFYFDRTACCLGGWSESP